MSDPRNGAGEDPEAGHADTADSPKAEPGGASGDEDVVELGAEDDLSGGATGALPEG